LSMEYGIHNSIPIYSGGLGILSGDHIKEASDLGIPIIAVGFLYQEGYFTQKISSTRNGWQEEIFREYDFDDLPIKEVISPSTNKPLLVSVNFKNEVDVIVRVWEVDIGRVRLFLLDSNIEENVPWYRDLTDRLYGGGSELRFQQELLLGFGSVRLFNKIGIKPAIYHLNEGHCSFSSIERIRELIVDQGMDFNSAMQLVRKKTLFTTHTPVPAGHDVFPFWMIDTYFGVLAQELGKDNLYSLGSYDFGSGAGYNMTVLGMRTASRFNAVAKLHREVTLKMFAPLFAELENKYDDFHPLDYVTNGTHVPSFVSQIYQEMYSLVDEEWLSKQDDQKFWDQMLDKYVTTDYQIWEYHLRAKLRLFERMRENSRENLQEGYWDKEMALVNGALLDPTVLTIGFARRFATYKRACLIFSDLKRLKKIINDPYRPVQFIFTGKAHPADDAGKSLIQQIFNHARSPELGHRIAFIENYDLKTAKALLQGVDVWLNNPIRYREASGTSGMKASMNFIPNFSILDGWWDEGYNGKNGWAINPENIEKKNRGAQDWNDAKSFYSILENEIIPLFYDYDSNIPFEWIRVMREAAMTTLPHFSARRMLKDYSRKLYTALLAN
ncbi:MAG: alpha-glucan family phosphorylase, partial [Promethearchaeota archaeon]